MSNILALGAQSKSSFCFVKGKMFYFSEPGGDLADMGSLRLFESKIKSATKKIKIKPEIIACDMHPEYVSTKLAMRLNASGSRLQAVQHHEAHVASCMVDNDVNDNVIGVAFDGTGFGRDGNTWGGEFFVGSLRGLKRAAHLKYVPMPGAEASVREPWRMAVSYLYSTYGPAFRHQGLNFLTRLDKEGLALVEQILDKNINSPLTSSMGRLFDAVSSLAGVCDAAKYEGEAAIELEKVIWAQGSGLKAQEKYDFKYKNKDGLIVIDWLPVIKGVVRDLKVKRTKAEISIKFHNAVCYMIGDVCALLRKKYKINKVCMSGGVFQNRYLTGHVKQLLEKENFKAYPHKNLPSHDGNIALGQAALAGA